MLALLSSAGRSFLRVFAASLLILIPGVLAAPNLTAARSLSIAALIASVVAGIKVLQEFAPQITTGAVFGVYGKIADSFLRAFAGTTLVMLLGVLAAPDLATAKALLVALIIGATTAGIRAVQGYLSIGDIPVPATGS